MFRMLYIRRSTAAHSSHRLVFWDWPKNTLQKKQHAAQQQLTSARSASPDRLPSVSIRPFGHSTINRLHPFPRCAGNCFFSLLRDDRPVVALRNTRRLSIPIALTIHTLAVPGPLLATLPPLWFASPPNPPNSSFAKLAPRLLFLLFLFIFHIAAEDFGLLLLVLLRHCSFAPPCAPSSRADHLLSSYSTKKTPQQPLGAPTNSKLDYTPSFHSGFPTWYFSVFHRPARDAE